jgi:pyridoxine 4-dehydrogenase
VRGDSTGRTQEGIAFIPWLPIANGSHATSALLAEVAAELDATPTQVSLAWLLHRSPVVVPIPGTKSEAHLSENVAAAQLRLSTDQLATLTSIGSRR